MIRRRWIPSTSALLAFESAARFCNFSRAADELATSQSAISRHIATLESRLGCRLFDRSEKRLRLTGEGEQFHRAVITGLEGIQSAAMAIAGGGADDHLTLACTHEISHLYLMPRFEALQEALGGQTGIHVMTADYDLIDAVPDAGIDLVLAYEAGEGPAEDRVVALPEAVAPVCAPAWAERHRAMLDGPVTGWSDLTLLDMTRRSRGWMTWQDWFAQCGVPGAPPARLGFDNYVYLLEAAAAGRGLALGWRGLIDRYLANGNLVVATERWALSPHPLYARLTRRGRGRPAARACLAHLGRLAGEGRP
jgi:LysR family transcriptional regulator, glycine cleavage system transcriptional activator